jgi:hypothetical protein
MSKFIHVQKAFFNEQRQLVDSEYASILNTDFIELIEPFELSRTDPGKYSRMLYKGEGMVLKGSVNSIMEKIH